jgi:hypothetical protein
MVDQARYNLIERKFQPHFGLVHAFYAVMGGFAFYGSYDDNTLDVEESLSEISANPHHTLDVPKFETLIYIMKHFPHIITHTTEESILDRAESSSLSKAILVAQVGWFCTNCASRLIQRLPLSLLEVSTAAHAFCTLITYFIWWSKPNNVAAPTILREKEAREVHALLKCSHQEYDEALEMAQKMAVGDSSTSIGTHGSEKIALAANALERLLPSPERPPYFFRSGNHHSLFPGSFDTRAKGDGYYELITLAVSPILYGLVHLLAWGEQFPTPLERLLWRVSSFVVTCSGLVGFVVSFAAQCLYEARIVSEDIFEVLAGVVYVFVTPLVHVLASGFLIAESFRQLFFLDPAAYQLPSWSNYWPHLS